MANLETECDNLLNPEFYSSKLEVYLGQEGRSNENIKVKLNELWSYNDKTMTYSKK